MSKKRLFELIRKEEVVLFAGAGMSRYAGYPSGAKLAEILHENLPEDLKEDIKLIYDLPKLCEEIFLIKGNKSYLIDTLKKEFEKKPSTAETHKLLAGIPQIKIIITTNYDKLIELENDSIQVIRNSIDYISANKNGQLLFKIHSDLTDIRNIILTSSDYLNYFTEKEESKIFWGAVKDKLATNHILFIGYSLEDTNVQDMIKKIHNEVGDFKKELYFVSPTIDKVKTAFLQKHNIFHIESTGEELIKEIAEDIRLNYLPDLAKGIGKADTALNFAKSKQLSIELKKSEEGLDISKVQSLDSNTDYQIDLKIELTGEKKAQFKNFIENKSFDELNLDADSISELTFSMKDLVIRNQDSLAKLTFKKRPSFEGNINILFDDDFEVDNYPFQIFSIRPADNESILKIVAGDFTLLIKLFFDPVDEKNRFHMEIFPPENIKSTYSGLQFYQILSRITENQKFKIRKDGKPFFNSEQFPLPFTIDAFQSHTLKEYFSNLKTIEKHFDITFTQIDSQQMFAEDLGFIISFIKNEAIMCDLETLSFDVKHNHLKLLKEMNEEQKQFAICDKKKTIINLHGHDFNIGYKIDFINDPIILNPEVLNEKKDSNIIIGSKSNKIGIMFSNERLPTS